MYKWIILLLALGLLSNCHRKIDPDLLNNMEDMTVPADFDYENSMEIRLSVQLPHTFTYDDYRRKIGVFDPSDDYPGDLLFAGSADDEGYLLADILIPSSLNKILIYTFAGARMIRFTPLQKSTQDNYIVDYNDEYGEFPPDTTPEGRPQDPARFDHFRPFWLKAGANWLNNGDFETDNLDSKPGYNSAMTPDGKWYSTNYLTGYVNIQPSEGNGVADFNSQGAYNWGGLTQLVEAEPGEEVTLTFDLKVLSGSPTLWAYLMPRTGSGQLINYYNTSISYPENEWVSKTLTITMPNNSASVQVMFWTWPNGHFQIDNAVLNIKGRIVDSDGDGIGDDEDAYPQDADKAFNSYYPGEETYGTLAFEDLWPYEGDYDFNDLVVDYRYNHIKNADNEITQVDMDFVLRAIGASVHNGLGIQFNIPPSAVSELITDHSLTPSVVALDGKGLESGQDLATIIVFEDAFNLLAHPGEGTGINTSPEHPYVDPAEIHISLRLVEPKTLSELGNAPNNPFIFRSEERGRELHLPGYPPTNLVNDAYFYTGDDATNPEVEYYYKTARGLPWGMNVPKSILYPVEKSQIIDGYLKFKQWAMSGGYSFMDWYEDLEGYRDTEFLFNQ